MYRVGFGDFFLLSLKTPAGDLKHILIDCGVHAGDIGAISDAVAHMATVTNNNLSLLIMTHRHADHISGFAKCKDVFSQFNVEQVWMSWFENRMILLPLNIKTHGHGGAAVDDGIGRRSSPDDQELKLMAENITGPPMALSDGGAAAMPSHSRSFTAASRTQRPLPITKAAIRRHCPRICSMPV